MSGLGLVWSGFVWLLACSIFVLAFVLIPFRCLIFYFESCPLSVFPRVGREARWDTRRVLFRRGRGTCGMSDFACAVCSGGLEKPFTAVYGYSVPM